MSLSDREVQDLQGLTKSYVRLPEGKVFKIDDTGKYYKIVHRVDNTTQAMAVAPVDDLAGNNPNYKETTIVVAGTQPVFGSLSGFFTPYFWKKKWDRVTSSFNAFDTSGYFGIGEGYITAQTNDIDKFYLETMENIKSKDKNAEISNMSGHSQSGPGDAYTAIKYGLKENRTIKVTNFMDFDVRSGILKAKKIVFFSPQMWPNIPYFSHEKKQRYLAPSGRPFAYF